MASAPAPIVPRNTYESSSLSTRSPSAQFAHMKETVRCSKTTNIHTALWHACLSKPATMEVRIGKAFALPQSGRPCIPQRILRTTVVRSEPPMRSFDPGPSGASVPLPDPYDPALPPQVLPIRTYRVTLWGTPATCNSLLLTLNIPYSDA